MLNFRITTLSLTLLLFATAQVCSEEVGTQCGTTSSSLDCPTGLILQMLNRVVQDFVDCRNWLVLRSFLEALLDQQDVAYTQLQEIDYYTNRPLVDIGYYGHIELASLLLCAGLPTNITEPGGYTMLHGAAENDRLEMVKLLLGQGAHVDMKNSHGTTPLMEAAYRGYQVTVTCLVQANANVTATNIDGHSAQDLARRMGRLTVAEYLEGLQQ